MRKLWLGRGLKKFFVLLWKNYVQKKRHWFATLLEIIIPTVLFCALVALRVEGGEELVPVQKNETVYPDLPLPIHYCFSMLPIIKNNSLPRTQFLYYPKNNITDAMMDKLGQSVSDTLSLCKLVSVIAGGELPPIQDMGNFTVTGVNRIEEIESITNMNLFGDDPTLPVVFGGAVFTTDFSGSFVNMPDLSYTMRMASTYTVKETEFLYSPIQFSGPQGNGDTYSIQTSLQAYIDIAYVELITNQTLISMDLLTNLPKWMLSLQQMPYPAYLENNLSVILDFMLPLFMILSFSFIVPPILKRIVHEKETGVKELMKMMGLPGWMHWICWYINCISTSLISIIIMVALIHINFSDVTGPVLAYSDPTVVFVFFFLYATSLIVFLFVISTLFGKPNLALAIGVLVHILSYIIPNGTINSSSSGYANLAYSSKILYALIPNVNLIWGVKMLMTAEGRGTGLHWNNVFDPSRPSDPFSMGIVWIMFITDIVIYGILVWYIDNINPGKYGVARVWYFPLLPSTWGCGESDTNRVNTSEGNSIEANDLSMFEKDPPNQVAGIRIRGLRKEFTKWRGERKVVAVDRVSFSAYHGEITTLLGHNGAGKTTTMSVLTGMYSATAGSATINGHSIITQMDKVRDSLGLCPQHNMLFEDLNVHEHFMFFGMLKGLSSSVAKQESKKYIKMLNLTSKRDVNVTNLSGGMKRKVNLGIALIGDSKVVMLDEPTSGMDPEARRGMWDLLNSLKKERTILLTTHFMEEADVLGDRIAIMARGKVQCYGTPFFLKSRFGSGYTLSLARKGNANVDGITKIVEETVQGAKLKNQDEHQIIYVLPTSESKRFPNMFRRLEGEEAADLGIANMGLSLTTMEDVFLKIGELSHREEMESSQTELNGNNSNRTGEKSTKGLHIQVQQNGKSEDAEDKDFFLSFNRPLTGFSLIISQWKGLLVKRIKYTFRRPILYFVMMLVPIGMAIFTVLSANPFTDYVREHPLLQLSLDDYNNPITFIGSNKEESITEELAEIFKKNLGGVGSTVQADNIVQTILDNSQGHEMLATYADSYIIGADFQTLTNLTVGNTTLPVSWTVMSAIYNSVPLHAKPLAQMQLSNTFLNYFENNMSTKHKISVATHPVAEPNILRFDLTAAGKGTLSTYVYGIAFSLGISILVSSFVIFPLIERATSAKQVQIMTGLNPGLFWMSNLVFDLFIFLVSVFIMLGVILALDKNNIFLDHGAPGAFALILILLGIVGTPFSYVISFYFNTGSAGFAFLIIVNILAGSIAPTAVFMMRSFGTTDGLLLASDIVRWIFTWFPIFPFSRALMAITTVQEGNNLCINGIDKDTLQILCENLKQRPWAISSSLGKYIQCCSPELVGPDATLCDVEIPMMNQTFPCHSIKSYFTWDVLEGINLDLVMLAVDGLIYFTILVLIEKQILPWMKNSMKNVIPAYYKEPLSEQLLDDDVLAEQERAAATHQDDVLTVLGLQKRFERLTAVQGLSFGVKQGECFGLLGINGAGKTTTFRMLTGDEFPTAGDATMMNHRLTQSRKEFLQQIGYCPQFDSIIPELTGRELLTLMCRVRGVSNRSIQHEVHRWTKFLGIEEYIDRESGSYSGGNKRKLNVAMSLVGEPPIVFLDEPSTGVDPVARRNLWRIIQGIQRNGQAVVLTSHSMEECEALCDRLAIMVNGQFQCFGSVPHLKYKFAQGFTLLIKLNADADDIDTGVNELKSLIEASFSPVQIKDEHKGYIHFHIENPSLTWHKLFSTMENIKDKVSHIEEYSISQTTLEQVFLSFAKKQINQE